MPYIGKEPEHGNYQLLDALTAPSGVFDGSRTVFNLTTDSVAVYPTSPTTMIISLGGVIQEPNATYTVSGNQITFTTAPATSTTFFGISLGDTLDIGTPSDNSVTVAKMASNSVDSAELVSGAVDRVHLAPDIIDGTKIDDGVIESEHYAAASIDNAHLADNAVDTDEIADDAVTYAKLQNLGTADRVLGSESTGVIGEVQIVPDMIATNAVTNVKVATGIDAGKLADGSVTNAELQRINSLSGNAQDQIDLKAPIDAATLTGTTTFATLSDGTIGVTAFLDSDAMSGASATTLSTSESIKAYVDNLSTGIDWETSASTGSSNVITAVAGKGYAVDCSSAAKTVNLPAGTVGDIIAIADYSGNATTNSITISTNGSEKIHGGTGNKVLDANRDSVHLLYFDSTQGWITVWGTTDNITDAPLSATGGDSVTTVGAYKVHIFLSSANFVVTSGAGTAEYLIVSGGGGAAGWSGGGGGAGGLLSSSTTITAQTYSIVVGAGGAGGANMNAGSQGVASSALGVSTTGGGYGGYTTGGNGGSGGGGGAGGSGGSGTSGQGNAGGAGSGFTHPYGHGAGGGAGAAGASHTTGLGGIGVQNNFDGNNYYYAGGGGGGAHNGGSGISTWSDGGLGGGGGGSGYQYSGDGGGSARNTGASPSNGSNGGAAGANTGGGGGGSAGGTNTGGNGGSGIVIIRYLA